ncbi:Hypothetical protein CINCED_3A020180 [Cinara cedri]|uniref:Proton-dependent oligopeptide transporter family,Major facilitator superfamily domain n=1 Tax=Cinara cedri TaxID=506608 RepID=A0A5E4M4M2_9HEMI|nr:Hypothetical protein CINCED_3A020180 [Cinara cedri]
MFCLTCAVLFVFGKSLYKIKKPTTSIITSSIGCIFRAIKNKITITSEVEKKYWLEYADDKYSNREIFELRSALDVMYLFIPLPIFYMLFDQQGSRWTLQGTLMNGRIDFLNWTIKPDQIHMLNSLFVIILLPLFDIAVYPILYKIGINTSIRKITLGGLFAALAFVCTATVQYTIFGQSFLALSTNEGNILRIYNGFGCKVTVSDPSVGNNFTIQSLDVLDINYYGPVSNETGVLSVYIDPMCELKTNTLNQRVSIAKEKVSSYILQSNTASNGDGIIQLKRLRELKKLKNGNPNLRFLCDERSTGRYITLRDVNNKLSEINIRLSPDTEDQSYETPIGTYNLYVDGEYLSQTVDLLPASVNDLLLRPDHKLHDNARLITTEKGKYIHILWQVPQTLFISIAEVMFVVTLLNFSFTQAPSSMKSIISAFNLFTQGVGNILIIIVAKMNLFENRGHEFLFYAILMIFSMIVFMLMSAKYKFKSATDDHTADDENNA